MIKLKKKKGCTCPCCGNQDCEIINYELNDDFDLSISFWCQDCQDSFIDFYCLEYDGYCHGNAVYDKDGELVAGEEDDELLN
jgi:hypothetical protein